MLKLYLSWFFCTCLLAMGQAQSIRVLEAPSGNMTLQKDTLRAIHRLFQARRQGTTADIFIGLLEVGSSIALVQGLASIAHPPSGGKPDEGQIIIGASLTIGLPGLILSGVGIGKGFRFSRKKEAVLASSYERGQGLPESIRRRLKAKHFR